MTDQSPEQEVQNVLESIRAGNTQETPQQDQSQEAPQEQTEGEQPEADQPEWIKEERVEIDDPKIQKRLDNLYKQVKRGDSTRDMLRGQLKEVNDALNTLYERNQQLEQWAISQQERQNKNDDESAMKSLRAQWKQALDSGDDDRVVELNEKIAEIKAEQKIKQWQQNVQAQQRQQAPQPPAQSDGWSPSQEDAAYVMSLTNELDQRGNFKRPWLQPGHADFDVAIAEANAIATKSRGKGQPITMQAVMAELDKRMMGQMAQQPAHASVLSSSMPNMPSGPSAMLSDDERHVARKLGLDEKEYKRMRLQLSKTNIFRASDFPKKKGN